jgi:catechol 2,3-dioxygenase-like lactoylglutathione lyase family enzyme
MTDLRFIQIALTTVDLAASVRFYNEVFRYTNGGGQVGWGHVMDVQGLDPDGQTLVWWLIGRHPRIQFEIFHHTGPLIRPQSQGWSPADCGWVRYGVAVADFNGVRERLARRKIAPVGPVLTTRGLRRFAIRDPWCGIIIEVWEDGDGIPGIRAPEGANASDPLILYATASVSDLAAARHFYSEILRLPIAPLELLPVDSDEALWGLAGAKRDGFLVEAGNGFLEIVEYASPRGRPRPADHRLSDQGII